MNRRLILGLLALFVLTSASIALSSASAQCPALTRIRFYSAEGQAARMLHGRFTGSNEGATTGFETLAEIKEVPKEHEWTELVLPAPVLFRFIKYEAPNGSWGNLAEVEFYAGSQKIQGTPFGTTGSRNNSGRDFSKAMDGDVTTFFDGAEPNNQYVGLDLGAPVQASAPQFSPPPGTFPGLLAVSLSCVTRGAVIRIARGGGTPTRTQGELISGPIRLENSEVVAAVAYADGLACSPVVVGPYRIGRDQSAARLTCTFHIGNSLTDTVDGWLKPMAESSGHPLDFHRFTIPGAPTDWLWAHPASGFGDSRYTEAFFAFAPFDAMITQPFAGHGRSVENEADYSGKFFALCRKDSPKVRLWLYQQWPDQTFDEGWSKGVIGLGGKLSEWRDKVQLRPGESLADGGWQGVVLKREPAPKTWEEAVACHTRYFELLRDEMERRHPEQHIGIIPAGPALVVLKTATDQGQIPGLRDFFQEFFADGIHLTSKGRYFVSLVHYGCLFGESPEGKVSRLNSGLTEEQAAAFQRIAWSVFVSAPLLRGASAPEPPGAPFRWGGSSSPNMASAARNLPADPGNTEPLWEIKTGTHQYSIPTVDRGRIFVAANDAVVERAGFKPTGGGVVMCLEQATGKLLWRLLSPRYEEGLKPPFHFDQWNCGICSGPLVDGDRVYVVGNRGEILCLDREGQANGNDGPFLDELAYMGLTNTPGAKLEPTDGDILWIFNLITELGVVPHDVCGSTLLLDGDLLYACTSNGIDGHHDRVPAPDAPSLIVLDKKSGRLVAKDGAGIGRRLLHCNWSSPVAGRVNGRTLIFFGGGDGFLYAFEPPLPSPGSGVQVLKQVWAYDCNPPDFRTRDGHPVPYAKDGPDHPDGPSEVIGAPVVVESRIYVAIGQSPIHGPGRGCLSCVDAATGRKVWSSELAERTTATAAIADGLLYLPDYTGNLHCFDAVTGQRYWVHPLGARTWFASAFVADGKVYAGTEANHLWVLKAGKELQVLSRSRLKTAPATPTAADGVLYLPLQDRLLAVPGKPAR